MFFFILSCFIWLIFYLIFCNMLIRLVLNFWSMYSDPFPNRCFLFLFLKFIYFNWRLITLQYCGGFCHTLTWISHGCTCVPHLGPTSHLFPHRIPQGHPNAPALSTLSHALNLDWKSVSHMILYMFQCYSLKSSHPRLLPQSPWYFSIPHTTLSFASHI